ncbi:MAG: CAP domain-containing protein, partial [Lachnospiraceae bacterium]|nr:CAP domain-containing protein [Lachnospiraceae bacterium]
MRRRLFGFMLAAMMIAGCSKQSDTIPEATIISRESEVIDTYASSEGMTSETDKETEKNISESFEATDVTEDITETNTSQTVNEDSMTEEPSEETSTAEASSEEATMEASTEERLAETEVLMTEPEQSAVKVSMTEPILPAETTVQQAQPSTQPPTQPPIETSTISVTPTVPEPTTSPITPTEPETTKVPEPTTEETTTVAVTTEPETTTVAPPTEPQKVYHDDYEKAKSGVDMINEYRRAAGVSEVKWSDAFYAAALIRAKQMYDSRSIAHLGDMGGEIHAMATSPGQAVAGWAASPGHYEYMINARYKYCAMAFYDNYCLAMFG